MTARLTDAEIAEMESAAKVLDGFPGTYQILRIIAECRKRGEELHEETKIVDRIWDILGRPSYEELAGRSIYDLVDALKADLAEARRMLKEARGELGAAINQSVATDDQIIMDHMRRAHQILDEAIARHQAGEGT